VASLIPDLKSFRKETDRLLSLVRSGNSLAASHRKLVAEIVLLRLSYLIENHVRDVVAKICCEVSYVDGSKPVLLAKQASRAAALAAMRSLGRAKSRNPIWNDGSEIRENVTHLIDPSDNCIKVLLNYGTFFSELRFVRNHIAHKNDASRKNFRKLLKKYYGAELSHITCGVFLLSERVSKPNQLESHLITSRILMRDLCRA
jgi:hypothetical protein